MSESSQMSEGAPRREVNVDGIESLSKDGVLRISVAGLSEEEILNLGFLVCRSLDPSIQSVSQITGQFGLMSGEALRPSGAFSVRYDRHSNLLVCDCRNCYDFRTKEYLPEGLTQLQTAVEGAVSKFNFQS